MNEPAVGVSGRGGSHRDDQDLLVLESSDKGGLVIVVNCGDEDAIREFIAALFPGKGCYYVFSSFKEGSGDVRSNCAPSLGICHRVGNYVVVSKLTPTMATLSTAFLKLRGWSLTYLGIFATSF